MPAFFGDVDVAVFVDAQQIGDELRRYAPEHSAVARSDDVHLLLGDEERAGAEDGFEPARLIALHSAGEAMAPARRAGVSGDGQKIAGLAADDDGVALNCDNRQVYSWGSTVGPTWSPAGRAAAVS